MVFGLGFLHAVKFKGGEISLQCSVQTAPATASPANNAHQLTSRPDFLDNTIFPTTPHILLDHTFASFATTKQAFRLHSNNQQLTHDHTSKMSAAETTKKSKWGEEAHKALVGSLLDIMDAEAVSYRKESNKAILVASMEQRGHKVTWEGIRYVLAVS